MVTDTQNHEPRAALARLYMEQGKREEAENLLRQAQQELPNDAEAYRMLGDFYFASGDLDKATGGIPIGLRRPSQGFAS